MQGSESLGFLRKSSGDNEAKEGCEMGLAFSGRMDLFMLLSHRKTASLLPLSRHLTFGVRLPPSLCWVTRIGEATPEELGQQLICYAMKVPVVTSHSAESQASGGQLQPQISPGSHKRHRGEKAAISQSCQHGHCLHSGSCMQMFAPKD